MGPNLLHAHYVVYLDTMIVYVPKWIEFAYLFTIQNKQIFYGEYEPSLFDEEDTIIVIKDCKDIVKYGEEKNILALTNSDKYNHMDNILIERVNSKEIIEKICKYFNYTYNNLLVHYCEKKEVCPFIFVYRLSLGDEWPKDDRKPLVPMTNTMGTLKFLQAALWYYYLGKKYHRIFQGYALDKVVYVSTSFIEMERDFGFIDDELSSIFFLPIFKFY